VSLRDTGGIERAMDYLFFQMTSINGFDSAGHYLRAGLLLNTCSTYAVEKTIGCEAKFSKAGATTRSTQALKGRKNRGAQQGSAATTRSGDAPISLPSAVLPGSTPAPSAPASAGSAPTTAGDPGATTNPTTTAPTTTSAAPATTTADPGAAGASSSTASDPSSTLLGYLLGGGK
jgi:hypothetical protein